MVKKKETMTPGNGSDYPAGLTQPTNRNQIFRDLLTGKKIIVAPGVFDCITARLVDTAGFPAVYVSGSGVSMSSLGAPDVGLLSFSEVAERVRRIADMVSIPVIADADTGYGGPLNVIRTVREFERAGVSAIQIEDQAWPKKCGHEMGRIPVPEEEMTGRIKAAVDARIDEDMVIVARTDARTTDGLQAALDRAALYGEAGADVLFVESPESEQEMETIARELRLPVLANMVEGGRTPVLPCQRLEELGFKVAIFPNSLSRLLTGVGQSLLKELKTSGSTAAMADQMLDHGELWELFESGRWVSLEQRFNSGT